MHGKTHLLRNRRVNSRKGLGDFVLALSLTRFDGNDPALQETAIKNAKAPACGHTFVLVLSAAYPIHVLNAISNMPEVCSIFCATTNAVEIIVAHTDRTKECLV